MNITLEKNRDNTVIGMYAQSQMLNKHKEGEEREHTWEDTAVVLELSKAAIETGFVRVKDENTENGNIFQVDSISIDSTEATAASTMAVSQVKEQQARLRALGFYSGSQDGNATSTAMKQSIRNFQKVYGLSQNGSLDTNTVNKLKTVYSTYLECKSSSGLATVKSKLNLDSTQTNNFALTWTFLKKGMGLNNAQAAGVMGNIYQESGFSPTNAQDSYGYSGVYNTNYSYKSNDGVGYGLMQWTYASRKSDLSKVAKGMNLGVGNINAQFALMKYESENTYKSAWNSLKKCSSHALAAEIVLTKIEQCSTASLTDRKKYAAVIYNAMN